MNCIIIDDEQPARVLIREYVKKLPTLNLLGEFKSPIDAIAFLNEQQVDLMFLDIQMPGLTGLEFIKTLQHSPKVILTTAYSEYALEGYELNVVDYLMKPIAFDRFLKAVNKALPMGGPSPSQEAQKEPKHIQLKSDGATHLVALEDILYIEGLREYVTFYTHERKIITLESLANLEKQLPNLQFVRVHKSFIINKSKVESFSSSQLRIGEKSIPIGKTYRESVLQLFENPHHE